MTVNLTAALHSNARDLSGVVNGLAGLSTDEEIEHQAKILDCIAEDANQGAAILRALIIRRKRAHGLLPRRVAGDYTRTHRTPPGPDSEAS